CASTTLPGTSLDVW
nr:immunoglobulin heavy chain junction region [Macaca mulatta]